MDVPADRSTQTAEPQPHPGVREAARLHRRRRPTGEPPPLPHHLQTSGVRWLVAMVVLLALAVAVFARGMRGIAVDVTVVDAAVVGWLVLSTLLGFIAVIVGLVTQRPRPFGVEIREGWGGWAMPSMHVTLFAYCWFTPNEVFPISYRRGRGAHLDVGGARGAAIRRGLADQLGLVTTEVKPFGLSGSAGSTPRPTPTGSSS